MRESATASPSPSPAPLVLLHVEDGVAVLTIDRPQARNAISSQVARQLGELAQSAERDSAVRVVVLTGAGDQAFCAGGDLKEMAAGTGARPSTPEGGFAGIIDLPRRKPWIAAVNGVALAGGLELLLACDFAVAVRTARFGLPEVRRGLAASANGIFQLPRVVPRSLALEMLATGEPISAERALAAGLVNHLVEPGQALPKAREIARQIAGNAPLAVAASLELARAALDHDEPELRRRAKAIGARMRETEDAREGPRAFAEGRAAVWQGR
jgi:enoyl-CoA hydratase/carnithine racemase